MVSKLVVVDVSPSPAPGTGMFLDYMRAMQAAELDGSLSRVELRKAVDRHLTSVVPVRIYFYEMFNKIGSVL